MAEHNGSYSTAFKNSIDWLSRIDNKVWKNKPTLLMATSPGQRGGATVLQSALNSFPHLGANIIANFSLPSFNQIFSKNGLTDDNLNNDLNKKIKLLQDAI
jgi:NAD(P)H-dependent FMN reductase